MKKNHILIMLFFACPVALLNAMDKEGQKKTEIELSFVEVQPGENTDSLLAHLKEIYSNLALEGKKEYVKRRAPMLFEAVKKTLETNGHILKVLESQAGEVGFVSYEVNPDDTITFHASPVEETYRISAYKKALEYVGAKHKEVLTVCIACPPFLQLHDDIKAAGFKEGSSHEQNPNFPKPDVELIMYSLDLTKLNS